jgi:hypothetical protein
LLKILKTTLISPKKKTIFSFKLLNECILSYKTKTYVCSREDEGNGELARKMDLDFSLIARKIINCYEELRLNF